MIDQRTCGFRETLLRQFCFFKWTTRSLRKKKSKRPTNFTEFCLFNNKTTLGSRSGPRLAFFCQSNKFLSLKTFASKKLRAPIKMFNVKRLCGIVVKLHRQFASKSSKCQELASINELPVPKGDFFKLYYERQVRHNCVLAFGIFMFVTASSLFYNSKINMNFSPPENYESDK